MWHLMHVAAMNCSSNAQQLLPHILHPLSASQQGAVVPSKCRVLPQPRVQHGCRGCCQSRQQRGRPLLSHEQQAAHRLCMAAQLLAAGHSRGLLLLVILVLLLLLLRTRLMCH